MSGRQYGFAGKALLLFLGSATGTFFFLYICVIAIGSPIQDSLLSAHGVIFGEKLDSLSPIQRQAISDLRIAGALLTPSELLSEIASFYETVITILTTLIAVLGVVAYMYVKSVSEESATKMVKERISERLSSDEHRSDIKKAIVIETKDRLEGLASLESDVRDELDRIQEIVDSPDMVTVKDLFERIKKIEQRIASLDTEDEEGAEFELGSPPSGK